MAMDGLRDRAMAPVGRGARGAGVASSASASVRSSSNCEMSAPETKALSPAPVKHHHPHVGIGLEGGQHSGIARHMSSEMALRRSGLLKIIQPIGGSRPISRSVPASIVRALVSFTLVLL